MRSDPVVYQVYPRSFQDLDGDGVGDLRGVASRLDHIGSLGCDAVWLSPFYPSGGADCGYDVTDHAGVDPLFGDLSDFEALVAAADERGLEVLLDLIPCHTSVDHPWFREHPDRYVWSPTDGPPNNWRSAFGGPAWSRDEISGRWYLHSHYPEQPDLDWTNPDVPAAFAEIVGAWRARGAGGFRLDALHRLAKDPGLRDDPPAGGTPALPVHPDVEGLRMEHSGNAPETRTALATLRAAAGDRAWLVGEVWLPAADSSPYLESLDAVFVFDLVFAAWEPAALRSAIQAGVALRSGSGPGAAWVLSNHDVPRLPSRIGRERLRAAAVLLLTLPGAAFVYQGEEIGQGDGPGANPPVDRGGRDSCRHPMQWSREPGAGFTSGEPWLPLTDPLERNVSDQEHDPMSLLRLYRDLIALRRELGADFELLDADDGVVAYRRDSAVVAVNTASGERRAPTAGERLLDTDPGARDARLRPLAAAVFRD